MEFRILGPLELVEDGRPVEVAGHRQRVVLALLLVHANEVVSSDRLIDGLWGNGRLRRRRRCSRTRSPNCAARSETT